VMFVTHAWLLASGLAVAHRLPFRGRVRFLKNALAGLMGMHVMKSG
jgi:hypothetical protein